MKDSQNITIGLLLVTAAILSGLLIGAYATRNAYADSPDKGSGYLMIAGQVSNRQDFVYVIDVATSKLNVYGYDRDKKLIGIGIPVDLNRLFGE